MRDYDPTTGRYITADPIGLNGGRNRYGYALGNPATYTDPSGQVVGVDDAMMIAALAELAMMLYVAYLTGQELEKAGFGQGIENAALNQEALGSDQANNPNSGEVEVIRPGGGAVQGNICTPSNPAGDTIEDLANAIGSGHAHDKHVEGKGDLKDVGIDSKEKLIEHIKDVLSNPSEKKDLVRDRTGYWNDEKGTIVVHDPNHPDKGTAFRPDTGKDYFDTKMNYSH